MANYAYLRVSTHTQDVENQKLSVLDYCNSQGIAPIEFVEDTTSGRRSWRDREIGRLLETADAGDVLVAAEVSRLARSTLQVLELLQAAADRGVTVHIAKNRMVLDQSLPATITATILGLAAQIEREFISARTKEALERRKAAGLPVGRPKGRATKLMLDDRRAEIVDYLNKGVSKRSVAKILGCSPTTLYSWIRRRRISGKIAIHALSVHFCSIATQTPTSVVVRPNPMRSSLDSLSQDFHFGPRAVTVWTRAAPKSFEGREGVHIERDGVADDFVKERLTQIYLAVPQRGLIGLAFVPPELAPLGDQRGYELLPVLVFVDH